MNKKLGRGRWNQVPDDKYAFNVSYANGDSVISMGKVFIIQTPKSSLSAKYRGYELEIPKVEEDKDQ